MDVLEVIKSDHQKMLKDIDELEKGEAGFREEKFNALMKENLDHMWAEENIFYPALEQEAPQAMMKSIEAHNIARISLDDLSITPKEDPWWIAKLQVFRDISLGHMREEEGRIFDIARHIFTSAELQEMGRQFQHAEEASVLRSPAREASAGSGR